jgi:hypothetical protein
VLGGCWRIFTAKAEGVCSTKHTQHRSRLPQITATTVKLLQRMPATGGMSFLGILLMLHHVVVAASVFHSFSMRRAQHLRQV